MKSDSPVATIAIDHTPTLVAVPIAATSQRLARCQPLDLTACEDDETRRKKRYTARNSLNHPDRVHTHVIAKIPTHKVKRQKAATGRRQPDEHMCPEPPRMILGFTLKTNSRREDQRTEDADHDHRPGQRAVSRKFRRKCL